VSLIKKLLNILLHIFVSKRTKSTNFIENIKPFVTISVFSKTIDIIFDKYLRYFFISSSYNEPLEYEFTERKYRCFTFDTLVVI